MTALFIAQATPGTEVASDDLEEVRWFDSLPLDKVIPSHRILAQEVLRHMPFLHFA
jgi:hypothetical protein